VATRETTYEPIPLEFSRLDADEALRRSGEFLELMQTRRSVRHFSSEPVPWELIESALLKAKIREAAEHEERLFYEQRAPEPYLDAVEPIGTDWIKTHITDSPYVIVVFEQVYGFEPDGSKKKHYYVRESVGIAVGFLLASLHAAGLATLTHSPAPMGFLARILERPENERPFVLIPVGYPAPEAEVPDLQKKPLEEITELR
jgi:iodotyrosine deiodinase